MARSVAAILLAVLSAMPAGPSYAVCTPLAVQYRESDDLARALIAYEAHMGELPPDLATLAAVATNAGGVKAGPFLTPPADAWWQRFDYRRNGSEFRIGVTAGSEALDVVGRKRADTKSYTVEISHFCGAP